MKPLVSIVVPCCNVERYIEQCLESIVRQTLKDIEIICINDGSKDNTLELIKKFAKKDARIKILDKANSGYGDSMNKGFSMANGEYIGIVESDDFIEPKMFEKLYSVAKENNADVVKSNFWMYWSSPEKNELHEYFKKEECNKVITPSKYDNGSLFGRKPSIWSAIYRRSFLQEKKIGFLPTPGASFQDTSFTFKVYCSAERMVCLYDAFLHYRQDNENSSVNNADKKAYCVCDEYKEIEKFIYDHPEEKERLYPIYGAAFYDTCIWMYERLGILKKYEFLKTISPWFNKIIDEVGVHNLNFGEAWWKVRDIERIANDPYEYHMWRHVERYEQIGHTFTYKLPVTKGDNLSDVCEIQMAKTEKPFFSIIIPVYNNEKFLRTCMDSLLFQTFKSFEVLCVNDESSDHSLSILEEYAELDDRFIIINQNNAGPAFARNSGLRAAIGEYVLFLDSDDYYSENACERIYEEICKKPDVEGVVFGTELFPTVPRASQWHYDVLTTPDIYYDVISETELLTIPYLKIYAWRCCYKRSFIKDNDIWFNHNYKYGEDALFMLEVMSKIKGVSVISDKLYNYRHFNENSLMNQIGRNYVEYTKQQLRVLEKFLDVAKENGISSSKELLEYACDFIYSCISNCPEPERQGYIHDFVILIMDRNLNQFIDVASDNCRGFWNYCYNQHLLYKKSKKLKAKIIKAIKNIVPPSRTTFYAYSAEILILLREQQANIDSLQRQLIEEQNRSKRIEEKCNEIIKIIDRLVN